MSDSPVPDKRGGILTHVRDLLVKALSRRESTWWQALGEHDMSWTNDLRRRAWWRDAGERDRARWVVGQLWNCGDTLPSEYCELLDLPHGSSFARAARKLKQDLP